MTKKINLIIKSKKTYSEVILQVTFITIVLILSLIPTLGFYDKETLSMDERRLLTTLPELHFNKEFRYFLNPKRLTSFLDDHFYGRRILIKTNNLINFVFFETSVKNDIYIGKDKWIYYSDARRNEDTLAYYQGVSLYTDENLRAWKKYLLGRKKMLAKQGIDYYFFIAPNKHTIYPEYLPYRFRHIQSISRHDQLSKMVNENEINFFIDLRATLMKAKSKGELYYQLDSHWNDRGAFVAYQKVMQVIQKKWFEIKILNENDITIKASYRLHSFFKILTVDDFLFSKVEDDFYRPITQKASIIRQKSRQDLTYSTNNDKLPNLLILGDSFIQSGQLYFFPESFNETVYLSPSFQNINSVLKIYKPNIIIQEIVERKLMYPPPKN